MTVRGAIESAVCRLTRAAGSARLTLCVALLVAAVLVVVAVASAAGGGGWDHLSDGGVPGSSSLNGAVYALNADRPGVLYVGGTFTGAGGVVGRDRIASWNGSAWSAVSSPSSQISNGAVNAIAYDAATGHLFAGGTFTNAGGDPNADFLAVWDGTSWAPFCAAIPGTVFALQIIGRKLYVGGAFGAVPGVPGANNLLRCDLDTGVASSTAADSAHAFSGTIYALTADSNGTLYAGGGFSNLGGDPAADNVAYLDASGIGWHSMGAGGGACSCAVNDYVRSLTALGTDVYVGTDALNVAGIPQADHVARWNGSAWSATGSNTAGTDGWFPASAFIYAMTNDGANVYATGSFQNANGDPTADAIASFDASTWHSLGSDGAGNGPWTGNGLALAVFGQHLYAGGNFTSAGGDTQASFIARYLTPVAPPPARLVTITVTGTGSVSGPGINCPTACSGSYPSGTSLTLTAHPGPGFVVSWQGGGCPATANSCQLQLNADKSVTASFHPPAGFDVALQPGTAGNVALPDCVAVDVPIVVTRDAGFTGAISLTVEGLPAGAGAQITPSAAVPSSEGPSASRTVSFSDHPDRTLPRTVSVRATSPGAPDRTVTLSVGHAVSTATLTAGIGLTPRHVLPGTQIKVNGNGFCPGTSVQVGNVYAATAATLQDPHTLLFTIPRLATTGPVTIVPPGGETPYPAGGVLTVASVRNTNGFQFSNYAYVDLSWDELLNAFGADDMFLQVNPCWPFGDCSFSTGIFNPLTLVTWQILNPVLKASGGHCFGVSRAVEQLVTGHMPLRPFGTGPSVWSLPGPNDPSPVLNNYLDGQHAVQFSSQFISAWLRGHLVPITMQISKLNAELAAGRDPIVTIKSQGGGHAMLAYDEQVTPTGVDIFVYDSNRNFTANENSDADAHQQAENQSVIHVNLQQNSWSFNIGTSTVWSGGDDGSLFVAPQSTIPDNPTLPASDLVNLVNLVTFGSADGSARTVSATKGAQLLPVLDSHAAPGAAGTWVSTATGTPLEVEIHGVGSGRYSESYTAPGFVGAVKDVTITKGVQDRLTGSSAGTVSFTGGTDRGLDLELAHRAARATDVWSASIQTRARTQGRDTAGISPTGTLTYTHDGRGSPFSFSLSTVRRDGGPAHFESGALRIAAGDRITVIPVARDLRTVRLQIRSKRGQRHTATLHNRARPPARLTLTRLRLITTRGRSSATLQAHISSLRGNAMAGIGLRLLSGSRVVAHYRTTVSRVRNGTRTFSWRLPSIRHGAYRLVADVGVVTTGNLAAAGPAAVHATRNIAVRI
jgi:hypothetical protein